MTHLRRIGLRSPEPRASRLGQGLVEFALVLPVLLLLLMVALDFGRIYLGWVNIQNMARIGANYAANNATEFATNDPATLAVYQRQMLNDAKSNNCTLPTVGGTETAPAPTFSGYNVGDTATVQLSCTFGVITPIISNIVGNTITVSASSVFPVKSGMVGESNTGGGGGGGGTSVTASFSCTPTSGDAALTVQCFDESGGGPLTWQWTIDGPGGIQLTSGVQDPVFSLTAVGSWSVRLVADNAQNHPSSFSRSNYITTVASDVDFSADKTSGFAPLTVKFTDLSSGSPTAWAWDFENDGTVDSTAQNPTFTYTTSGPKDVKLTVTTAAGTASATKTAFVIVGQPGCTVPPLTSVARNQADRIWTDNGFDRKNLTNSPGAPNGNNWTIDFQSITAGSVVPCSSTMQVNGS
jgi:PKD repeat protein